MLEFSGGFAAIHACASPAFRKWWSSNDVWCLERGWIEKTANEITGTSGAEALLPASEREGQPISGKFEMDEGKLQPSVYTAKDGKFYEVIVDHATGAIAKVEPITEGEDLAYATSQKSAMDRAKVKLADAATRAKGRATGEAAGVLVVSAHPELKDGHPVVAIVLLEGKKFSTASEPLGYRAIVNASFECSRVEGAAGNCFGISMPQGLPVSIHGHSACRLRRRREWPKFGRRVVRQFGLHLAGVV